MAFKPCASCPSPAKCKAAGKCMKKTKAKGAAMKDPGIMIAIAIPAKKGAKRATGTRKK